LCNEDVLAGLGLYVFNAGGWDTFHTSADCPQVHELPLINWNCVALMESLEMFIVGLPRTPKVIEVCEELLALSTAHTASLPFDLALPLMEFQKAGVSYALKARRTLLCDAMGLGKSCQAIAVAIDVKLHGGRTVIVCPSHLRLQWLKEIKRFAPSLKTVTVTGRKPYGIGKSDVLVISDSVINYWALALKDKFTALIVDEAHSIKNEKAGRTKGVRYLAQSIPTDGIIMLMSGTLTPNRPSELLSPLSIIGRLNSVFGSRKQFLLRYCDYRIVNGFVNKNGATNTTELNTKLRGTCMVRRRKEDVLSDLPPKRRAQIDVELSASEMATYRKAEDDFLLWVFSNYGKDAWQRASKAEIITRMNKLREILGIAKIRSVVEHVKSLLSEDEQVVVFAYHRKVIEGIKEALKDYGVVVVAGGSTPEQKEERVEKFMKGEAKVFIGQYQSAGSGLNLTCASNVVLAEMTYTPAEGQQAEDRCHRIGQPYPIVAWWITAVDTKKPTMDMRMWALLNQKSQVTSATMDGWAENLNADAGTMTAQLLQDMLQEY